MEVNSHYRIPVLAKIFHKLPHLNYTFHSVESTFNPESTVYLESLGILASLPALWLIATLLLLLVYLCTRCCDRKPRPKNSINLMKWTLFLFTLLCCGALAVGLYGNDDVHNAVVQFTAAVKSVDDIVNIVRNQTNNIEKLLKDKVNPLLTDLSDVFEDPVANQTARAMLLVSLGAVKGNATSALASCLDISRPLQGIHLRTLLHYIQLPETIRWPATIGVLALFILFLIILIIGVTRHSRCCLILFSVFGLFGVIVNWLLTSVYLASSVALGDLCVAPEEFLRHESPSTLQPEVLRYYVNCVASNMNPFTQRLREAQRAVDAMTANLNVVSKIAQELYRKADLDQRLVVLTKDVHYTDRLVSGLAALLDCRPLQAQYVAATRSVCDHGLYGLAFMLLASLTAGVLFSILVWVDSHTWIYIRKRRDYLQVAEQDPFLPPSAASQAIAARTLRHQGSYHGPPTAPTLPVSSPSSSPRYTPLPSAPSFRERLRDPSIAGSVYYDPSIIYLESKAKQSQTSDESANDNYDYYSNIGMNSNLTSERRGWNYNSRDSELVDATAWSTSRERDGYSPNATLESRWTPR